MKTTTPSMARNVLRIRQLNDACRTTLRGCRLVVTRGIASLPVEIHAQIMKAIVTYDSFIPDSDPHGEHDFGNFDLLGYKVFWKFDYYDTAMRFGSPDPADPAKTCRVLTVMLASEY